jgi:hypothetical protein
MKNQFKRILFTLMALSSIKSYGQLYGIQVDAFELSKGHGNPQTGITVFNIHKYHSFGISYNVHGSQQVGFTGQVTPTGFHHAYLSKTVAPLIGLQAYRELTQNNENSKYTWHAYPQIGFKYAFKRLVGACSFSSDMQNKKCMLNASVGIILFVPNRCLKKRLDNHYSTKILRF